MNTKFTLLSVPQFTWFQKILSQVMKKISKDNKSMSHYLIGLVISDLGQKNFLNEENKRDWIEYNSASRKTRSCDITNKRRFSLYLPLRLPWIYEKLKKVTTNRSTYVWDLMLKDNFNLLDARAKEDWSQYCSRADRKTNIKELI